MRYSLALLMILAFGSFQRMGLKINTGISYKLILFWIILSKEVTSRSKNNSKAIWNVYFKAMPHWTKIDKSFISILNDDIIESLIQDSEHEYNHQKEEYNLYIDFNKIKHHTS